MDSMREWSKPELIVLGRGAPEENVLCTCKTKPSSGWCQSSRCATKIGRGSSACFRQNNRPGNS